MCNKIKYNNKISALIALAKCKNATKGNRLESKTYYCTICKAWHLTSKGKSKGW